MIELNLHIGSGDAQKAFFETINELCEYLQELKSFDCVWLACSDTEDEESPIREIVVTETIDKLIFLVESNFFDFTLNQTNLFFVQSYESYEDAYAVACDMREDNPKCYN